MRELANGLEAQVRVRTQELERSTRELLAANKELEREIVERRRAEENLRRSEAFLAEGQRLSLTGSFSWSVANDEITWSEQLYRIYEFEIGVPVTLELIRTRVHPEDISLLEKMKMVDQARGGSSDFEWQYRLLMPDHSIKYLHAVAHATRDQDGQLEYIAAVQDVTERRMSEEALGKAQIGTRTRRQSHEPRSVDCVDRARSQPASVGHHHQRQHLSADAGRRSSQCRRRARNRAAHDSRRQPCI